MQHFSKLFYKSCYKKAIHSKWAKTYISYYERVSENLTEVDQAKVVQSVTASIKEDYDADLLDTSLDPDDEEGRLGDQERDKRVPKPDIWFINAIKQYLWDNASPSQQRAVEKEKEKEDEMKEGGKNVVSNYDPDEDDEDKVKRLEMVIGFVTSQIW